MKTEIKSYDVLKRAIDLLGAGTGLVILSPLIGAVALSVRLRLGSPILFRQERPGKNARIFTLYKFRSMLDVDNKAGLVRDEDRLTNFGKILRSTSLDELPSLVNVLKGDMSLVGPRPLLTEYLDHYTPDQARRHEVRPGITGYAQVNGRNLLTWEEKFAFDVEYVERRSLAFDFGILIKTIKSVSAREGINQDGHATAKKFGAVDA